MSSAAGRFLERLRVLQPKLDRILASRVPAEAALREIDSADVDELKSAVDEPALRRALAAVIEACDQLLVIQQAISSNVEALVPDEHEVMAQVARALEQSRAEGPLRALEIRCLSA